MVCLYPNRQSDDRLAAFPQALIEAARGWRSKMDALLRPHGLTSAMGTVLACLAVSETPLSQRELAQAVGVEGPTLVRLLDRLEEGGFARRMADPNNRRVKRVGLTDKAADCFDAMHQVEETLGAELLRDIPESDIATAQKVLLTICDHL